MTQTKILVVDDNRKMVDSIKRYLEHESFQVFTAYSGSAALKSAREQQPGLVILDIMLPHIDGYDVCRLLRAESDVPIIMLTAKTLEEDKLRGLDLGADDYITKPFSPRELVARVKTVLRRWNRPALEKPEVIHQGDLTVDFISHQVLLKDRPLNLTPKEFNLLEVMIRAPGRAFSREDLIERAFGAGYPGLERTVDAHIMNLRRKIERDSHKPVYIHTVYGFGYKFNDDIP